MMDWLWSPAIWVPPGYTWKDLEEREGLEYPEARDVWVYPLVFAVLQLILKYLFLTPHVFLPLGAYLGVQGKRVKFPAPNGTLEAVFRHHGRSAPDESVAEAADAIGWTERQVQRWLRRRAAAEKDNTMDKFADCAWQLTYYTFSCSLGVFVLYDKVWLYDIDRCWDGFPLQSASKGIRWYFMFTLGFYWLETLTHFLRPRRNDSAQVFVHHICAIILISCSWISNITRLGSLNILLFECNDIPLLLAKLFGYCGKDLWRDAMYVVFVAVWVTARLVVFPMVIMKQALSESYAQAGNDFHMYYIFCGLLFVIMIMNLMWTYSIVRVIVGKVSAGEVRDPRSSDDDLSNTEENVVLNGKRKSMKEA